MPVMETVILSRLAYTQYKRSKHDFPFSTASTAMPPKYEDENFIEIEKDGEKQISTVSVAERQEDAMAILPQYITDEPTTLVMKEIFPPLRHGNFEVRDTAGQEIFKVVRETASLSRRRDIIDSKTGSTLMTLRRDVGSLPHSHYLQDPAENKVLELQGKFYVPFQGPRSAAAFLNASSGQMVDLFMTGSWLNRNVEIVEKATGRVVARAEREVMSVRNALGGRTTYTAHVEAGVDLTIVIGLIVALDDRAD